MPSKKFLAVAAVFGIVIVGVLAGVLLTDTQQDTPANNTHPTGPNGVDPSGNDLLNYDESDFPRGIDRDQVFASTIADAYQDQLDRSTFTLRINQTIETENGTRVQETVYKKAEQGVSLVSTVNGEVKIRKYSDSQEEAIYIERHTNGDVTREVQSNAILAPTNEQAIRALLRGGEFVPKEGAQENNGVAVTLLATKYSQPSVVESHFTVESLSNISGTATVGPNQMVRQMNVTLSGTDGSAAYTHQYESTVTDVNGTIVNEPLWVSDARETTRKASHGVSGDGRSLFVTHENGTELPAGTVIVLSVDRGDTFDEYRYTLNQPVESGNTLYLSLVEDDLTVTKNEAPPRQGDELASTLHYVELIPPGDDAAAVDFSVTP